MAASTLKHLEGYLSAACNNIELYTRAALFTSQQLSHSNNTLWPTVYNLPAVTVAALATGIFALAPIT